VEAAALAAGTDLLEREAIFLDEQRWDDWLALFIADCEYWIPTWRHDETLTEDPRQELSHIYYASRAGLEDRIVRIRSGRSPASMPLPRTTHLLGNIRLTEPPTAERLHLRSSWTTQVFFTRSRETHAFFGHATHELILREGQWRIARKKIVLQNDYIPGMLDIYCV
jgi:benzoate/toluate 1,2-dioxygenase beta subunit/anthranilate 1,2-dioxygenase (deaminating, decarboxylating) small subunit